MADWAAALQYEDLSEDVIHHVGRSLLDYLGVTLAGSQTDIAQTILASLPAATDSGASVIGSQRMLSPANAAFANGAAAVVCELDDGHVQASLHVGSTCIPAILALAEARGASMREVVVAIAAAAELSSRVGVAVNRHVAEQGFHPTPLIGVFAAVIGAAKILGCDATEIANAVGMAGSNAGGLFDYHGGWLDAWAVNIGRVNRDGICCADLAARGIAGPVDLFEGAAGFAAAFTNTQLDTATVLSGLGDNWLVTDSYIKMYPSCRRIHGVIDAVLALRAKVGTAPIDSIRVETSADTARLDSMVFDTMAGAQMSVPYCVAAGMIHGALDLQSFDKSSRSDPDLRRLAERVTLHASDDPVIADLEKLAALVAIEAGGETHSETVIDPWGDPSNPVTDADLDAKFRNLAQPLIGDAAVTRIVDAIRGISSGHGREVAPAHVLADCRVQMNNYKVDGVPT